MPTRNNDEKESRRKKKSKKSKQTSFVPGEREQVLMDRQEKSYEKRTNRKIKKERTQYEQ